MSPAALEGATHFLEHLLFKGSSKYTAEEIAQIFDTLGGELNASTSREYVVVYGRFLDDQLPVAMDVMADMLLTPTFTDLDREREVILEEIAMVEDSPQDLIHDVLAEVVLDGHPLAHPILGTRESIAERLRGRHPRLSPSALPVQRHGGGGRRQRRPRRSCASCCWSGRARPTASSPQRAPVAAGREAPPALRRAKRPSRCTSASAAWAWPATTSAASSFRCSTACSGGRSARGSSRRCARSGAWCTACTRSPACTRRPG